MADGCNDSWSLLYPSSMLVIGSSFCGKTTFIKRLLNEKKDLYQKDSTDKTEPEWNVLYCYNIYQPLYAEMQHEMTDIKFKPGLPSDQDIDRLSGMKGRKILILDDLADVAAENKT